MLLAFLERQNEWIDRVLPNVPIPAVTAHIRSELIEIRKNPGDLTEWMDVAMLAFGGAYRIGECARDMVDWFSLTFRDWNHQYIPINRIFLYIEKTCISIETDRTGIPFDWTEIAMLAFQGAFQQGASTEEVIAALLYKQQVNFTRRYKIPENLNDPWEHVRDESEDCGGMWRRGG